MCWPYVSERQAHARLRSNPCRRSIFQHFIPFFRALQKFHLVESPMKVSPLKVVVNAIHNTCRYHGSQSLTPDRQPLKSGDNAKPTEDRIKSACPLRSSSKVHILFLAVFQSHILRTNRTIGIHTLGNHHLLELKNRLCRCCINRGLDYMHYFAAGIVLVEWGGTEATTLVVFLFRQVEGTHCFRGIGE
jgi:hypothetical protein